MALGSRGGAGVVAGSWLRYCPVSAVAAPGRGQEELRSCWNPASWCSDMPSGQDASEGGVGAWPRGTAVLRRGSGFLRLLGLCWCGARRCILMCARLRRGWRYKCSLAVAGARQGGLTAMVCGSGASEVAGMGPSWCVIGVARCQLAM